ncbi:MAG TPA: hypothetical protein VLL76_09525 [Candidatus Omnitrophota bacterium]|nr:hypothetical protein [Candidatus Omnitrophota bacterium]
MTDHAFYAQTLRFVAGKTERVDDRVAAMMDALTAAAADIEQSGAVAVAPERIELTARAFAGVAGFLQKQILPEVVAHANQAGERQVRWSIDTSMDIVNRLLGAVARGEAEATIKVELPPPPGQ